MKQILFAKCTRLENLQLLRLLQNVQGGRVDMADYLFLLKFLSEHNTGFAPTEIATWVDAEVIPPEYTLPFEETVLEMYPQDAVVEAFGS